MVDRILLLSLVACGTPSPILIRTMYGTAAEEATADQLRALLARHDLTPWTHTNAVVIDETSIPHSHPELTLHARHLRDDLLLLSTYIHEQSHWVLEARPAATSSAVAELERLFPDLPVGFPDGGETRRSSYEHLIVILLEHAGLVATTGELAAYEAIAFWSTDHYRALYRLFLDERRRIQGVARRHGFSR
jgi:hypothetical protein